MADLRNGPIDLSTLNDNGPSGPTSMEDEMPENNAFRTWFGKRGLQSHLPLDETQWKQVGDGLWQRREAGNDVSNE